MSPPKIIAAAGGNICRLENPKVPEFRYEWHENTKRLYHIRVGTVPEVAEIVAEGVQSLDLARLLCVVFCRGVLAERTSRLAGGGTLLDKVLKRYGH